MKIRLLNLLIIGSIVSSVMLSSCSKDDNPISENPDYSQDNGVFKDARDSKEYKWVKIGDQIWMAENLAYTGSGIHHITDGDQWESNLDYDAWCYYDNEENYGNTYGVLYQWEAAKSACPSSWHLPTDEEWTQLENYLKENAYSYDGVIGNNGIAKSLATNSGWSSSEISGAVGNSDFPNFRNKTGFSALPGGIRNDNGSFYHLGDVGFWWSATEVNISNAYDRIMYYVEAPVYRYNDNKSGGFSVRCVRD